MGLADERKPVNLMTVHVSKSVTVHEVSNNYSQNFYAEICNELKNKSKLSLILYKQSSSVDCSNSKQ